MKRPQTLAELQRLLRMKNFSRAYIPRYAEIAKQLYDLMNVKNVPENLRKKNGAPNGKKVVIDWTRVVIEAFEQ